MYINSLFSKQRPHNKISSAVLVYVICSTEILCEEHEKLQTFLDHCFQLLWLVEIFQPQKTNPLKKVKYKTAFLCSFMHFLCENETPMWGSAYCTKAKEIASGVTGSVVYSFSSVQLETLPPTRYFVFIIRI